MICKNRFQWIAARTDPRVTAGGVDSSAGTHGDGGGADGGELSHAVGIEGIDGREPPGAAGGGSVSKSKSSAVVTRRWVPEMLLEGRKKGTSSFLCFRLVA